MECFCKGAILGMVAGVCVGAIIVAKNKKLSNKINQGVEVAEEKIKEIKDGLEEKFNSDEQTECKACDCGQVYDNYASYGSDSNSNISKNNFSKKDKKWLDIANNLCYYGLVKLLQEYLWKL